MADEIDLADEIEQARVDNKIKDIQEQARNMPKGSPGDCEYCGEWSGRLVDGACSPCRDRYKL